MKTILKVVNGNTFHTVPSVQGMSCTGCVAQYDTSHLCSDLGTECITANVIWQLGEVGSHD